MNKAMKPFKLISRILNRLLYRWHARAHRKSYGPLNADKTFYVIRSVDDMSKYYTGVRLHLLANYSYVVSHLMYAQKKGWLPIIDQLNYPVYNGESYLIHGSCNPWEYFWAQPIPQPLEEVYRSKNVVLSKRNWYKPGNLTYSVQAHEDRHTIQSFHALTELVPLNAETAAHCMEKQNTLFCDQGKILGISLRRGGYAKNDAKRAPNHPIQPGPEEMIQIAEERMREWGMDAIFLATEDSDYIDIFKKAFGGKLLYLPRLRFNGEVVYTPQNPNPMYLPGSLYNTSLDYLTEMELLAACHCLIGTITSGLRYAILRNNALYEHLEILDYGQFAKNGV